MQIAIIDDSISSLQSLAGQINAMVDCTAIAFSSPQEGLAWCIDHKPDLILVDYHMPGLNGLGFIAEFRADASRHDIPIIMITVDLQQKIKCQALQLGASDFLGKPFDPIELQARVRNLLQLRRAHNALASHAESLAGEVRVAHAKILDREREAILVLSRAAEHRDPETGCHLDRMGRYSRLIAQALGLSQPDVDVLYAAAPMHDVGKIATPDHILLKPGQLTPEETSVMQGHTVHGHGILAGSNSEVLAMASEIALHHHERFDGTGYPHGLAGENIPLTGRIVAVADVFDALNSVRPYKPAWPIDKARTYIEENRGTHFDPRCVDAFLSRWNQVLDVANRYSDATSDWEEARGARYVAALQASQLTSISQLAAGIAHEINTPLQYMGDNLRFIDGVLPQLFGLLRQAAGLAERAAGAPDLAVPAQCFNDAVETVAPPDLRNELSAAINDAIGGVDRIATIVLSIMKFCCPAAATKAMVNLNETLQNALVVSRSAWKHVAEIECTLSPVPMVLCNVMEMNQVFLNLIINAIYAIESSGKPFPGRITIATAVEDGQVVVRLSDSGGGIPEQIRRRIFEPFFTTRDVGRCTGQGLAICRDIVVARHGGGLEVDGNEGVGATFMVRLPIRDAISGAD